MRIKCFFFLFLLSTSNLVFAENGCPDGMTPFQNGGDPVPKCYPIQGSENTAPAQPRGRWETRWGAIATDGSSAAVGTVIGLKSKRQATTTAMKQCRAKGGKACKVIGSYYNQCAVIVSGDKQHQAISAATINEAAEIGMSKCSSIDTNCRVYYAECSPPVWIQ
jgi:Domain of unknown function (DUF4189)